MSQFDVLLQLQEADTHTDQLKHKIANHPLNSEKLSAEDVVAQLVRKLELLGAERLERTSAQRAIENDIETVSAKVKKDDASLYDGTVNDADALVSVQHQIDTNKGRIAEFEEALMVSMEELEPIVHNIAVTEHERDAAQKNLDGICIEIEKDHAQSHVEIDELNNARLALTEQLPEALLAEYEKLRVQLGGQAAAPLERGGKCTGCHLTLARADYELLKREPDDAVMHCPECGRILIRS